MSETKHTPGPWEWDEPSNWYGTAARVMVREPYGKIAQVQLSGWKPRSMAIANARLIAAAPDLLAACEAALEACELEMQFILDNNKLRETLQAAIAKAKGGTQ